MNSFPDPASIQHLRQGRIVWLSQRLTRLLLADEQRIWSEHELLTALRAQAHDQEWLCQREGLGLFQLHFLVFHCLYRLRDRWRADGERDLAISALAIHPLPWQPGQASLSEVDPLANYYRDLNELEAMDERGLRALLDGFWKGMPLAGQRDQALETLGLNDPIDDTAIRRRYRELAMKHHPDRGGDAARLQAIHHAMKQLGLR